MSINHAFSAVSFIGSILVSVPLAWHRGFWFTGRNLYVFWVALSCLISFINSVIWDGNIVIRSPFWCDITSRIILGVNIAVPAAGLCIQRHLYHIISGPDSNLTGTSKSRRSVIIDLSIGLGLPVVNIALAYIVQGHRYDIFEDVGCHPVIINTALSAVLVTSWPIAIGLVSAVYCCLNVYHLWINRGSLGDILPSSDGAIGLSRFLRFMILSGIDLLWNISFGAWALYAQLTMTPVISWPGLKAAHADFSYVGQVPASLWRHQHKMLITLELTRWSSVMFALVFFILFALSAEAMAHYVSTFRFVVYKVGGLCPITKSSISKSQRLVGLNTRRTNKMQPVGVILPIFISDTSKDPMSVELDCLETPVKYNESHNQDGHTYYRDAWEEEVVQTPPATRRAPSVVVDTVPLPLSLEPPATNNRRKVRPPPLTGPFFGY